MANKTMENILATLPDSVDLGECTSLLSVQAAEIKAQKVNWQSYLQSQMISQEDYNFILAYDNAVGNAEKRNAILAEHGHQCAKTFLNLLGHICKDQTIQYLLILIEDMLTDKDNCRVFRDYAKKKRESVWAPFLNLLNRPDDISVNLTAWVVARLACDGRQLMDDADLQFYFTWLKDQLKRPNNQYIPTIARCLQLLLRVANGDAELCELRLLVREADVLGLRQRAELVLQIVDGRGRLRSEGLCEIVQQRRGRVGRLDLLEQAEIGELEAVRAAAGARAVEVVAQSQRVS